MLIECKKGDFKAAEKRVHAISNISLLEITPECVELAQTVFEELQIPPKASDDSLHIALACIHQIDYLLSWNFKHIVNASMIRNLSRIIEKTPYSLPQICTPEKLVS